MKQPMTLPGRSLQLSAAGRQASKDKEYDKAEKLEKTIASLNIGCMVCHNKMAIIHKYADGYPQPDTVYGSRKVIMKMRAIPRWR